MWLGSKPATRAPFLTDEWASAEAYTQSPLSGTPVLTARSRAASSAHRVADEALSWITPPPGPLERNRSGRPRSSTSQSRMTVSISVQAGLVAHSIPFTPRPAATSSPRIAGGEAFAGKNPKKPGACQCIVPGTTIRSRSARTAWKSSGCSGAELGSIAATSPGAVLAATG